MLAATPKFLAAVQSSHRVATLVQVQDTTGKLLVDGATQRLTVIDGSVSVDRAASIRRQCSVTLADPTGLWTPASAGDPLSPFTGNELKLSRGVSYDDGTQELIPLGVFRISQVAMVDSGAGFTLAITGYDRSRTVQRSATTDVVSYAAGTLISSLVQGLIQPRVPTAALFAYSPTTAVTPSVVQFPPATDVWKEAQTASDSIGFETFFDVFGNNVFQPIPVPANTAPSLTLSEGALSVLTSLSRTMDDSATYNDIIVTGQSTGLAAPVISAAPHGQDVSGSSPTNIAGGFGVVPQFVQSDLIPDVATANAMADGLLTIALGTSEELAVGMIPNPTVDVNDIVSVTRARLKLVNALCVVESLTIPLAATGEMQMTMRRVR